MFEHWPIWLERLAPGGRILPSWSALFVKLYVLETAAIIPGGRATPKNAEPWIVSGLSRLIGSNIALCPRLATFRPKRRIAVNIACLWAERFIRIILPKSTLIHRRYCGTWLGCMTDSSRRALGERSLRTSR